MNRVVKIIITVCIIFLIIFLLKGVKNYRIHKILEADFNINPKIIDGENIGCKYCKYQDICFIKELLRV